MIISIIDGIPASGLSQKSNPVLKDETVQTDKSS
jgi:hypothetical protein